MRTEPRKQAAQPKNLHPLNQIIAGRFELFVDHDDEYQDSDYEQNEYKVTYGFKRFELWYPNIDGPNHGRWIPHPDISKFQVTGPDFQTAKAEFWTRFNIWSIKRFRRRIAMESTYQQRA